MCSTPKPPPPPPPQPPTFSILQDDRDDPADCNSNFYVPVLNNPSECLWADEDPELRRACIVARICLDKAPYRHTYKKFKSIIQVGPTCGLAALSMLIYEQVSPENILTIAQDKGYTNYGEMLSCKNMGQLVRKVLTLSGIDNLSYSVVEGELNAPETIDCLLNGGSLLVPYDADVTHTPALRNGHTAHWCLVTGIIIIDHPESTVQHEENVYVLCRHGKSKYLAAWKLSELANSNKNLWEFSPKKRTDGLEYIQPNGGLGGENGLRGQFLLFNWFNNNISDSE